MIGVFTQPYVKVEENEDIINLYNSCIPLLKERNKEKQLQVLGFFNFNLFLLDILLIVFPSR